MQFSDSELTVDNLLLCGGIRKSGSRTSDNRKPMGYDLVLTAAIKTSAMIMRIVEQTESPLILFLLARIFSSIWIKF